MATPRPAAVAIRAWHCAGGTGFAACGDDGVPAEVPRGHGSRLPGITERDCGVTANILRP